LSNRMVEGGCGNENDAYGAYADDWRRAELAEPNFDMDKHVAEAWEWWRSLGSPQCVVAPMVDASELPWRVLSRRYGATLCYTPMFHASNFVRDHSYRRENFPTVGESPQGKPGVDRPLFVQFCANDKDIFAAAANLVKDRCDAIDLNLGCPQMIAKRGHYGSHMQEDWSLIRSMIENARLKSGARITAKIRIMENEEVTLRYARLIERAGASLLTVHGRTREQRGQNTGLADWQIIAKIKQIIRIPVLANGNIQCGEHVRECLAATGVNGIMSAEGNLYNPCLFADQSPLATRICIEFLAIEKEFPAPALSMVRGHLFKMLHHIFKIEKYAEYRQRLASAISLNEMKQLVEELHAELSEIVDKDYDSSSPKNMADLMALPFWRLKPYVRPISGDTVMSDKVKNKRKGTSTLEQNKRRKEQKAERVQKYHQKAMNKEIKTKYPVCIVCPSNPRGQKCPFQLCRKCCEKRIRETQVDCIEGHKLLSEATKVKKQRDWKERCERLAREKS